MPEGYRASPEVAGSAPSHSALCPARANLSRGSREVNHMNVKIAVERLGAVRLADGGYAYRAAETGHWYIVSGADLEALGERLAADDPDAAEVDGQDHNTLDAICAAGGAADHDYTCQCGKAMGERCMWRGHRRELHLVRWVPESDRGSAQACGGYTYSGYARTLYVSAECARTLAHMYEDGEQTEALDPYVRDCGPAYEAAR